MAVHAVSGTLTASTAATTTLSSWQPYIIVTLTNTATPGPVYVTVDGTVATIAGVDNSTVNLLASGTTTVAFKNLLPRPVLQTTTPLVTDPSAVDAFTTAQTKISVITALTGVTYNAELSPNAGGFAVLA
jgi:hypothetical protein